jgi:hypothetical protein
VRTIAQYKGDPIEPARLFIGGSGEDDVASESRNRIGRWVEASGAGARTEETYDTNLDGERPLHINSATPPHVSVFDNSSEWLNRPTILVSWNNIKMRKEEQRTIARIARVQPSVCRCSRAAQAHADIATIGDWLVELRLKTFASKELNDDVRCARLVARGVHTFSANQLH